MTDPMFVVAETAVLVVKVATGDKPPPWLACSLDVASVAEIVDLVVAARRTGRLDIQAGDGVRSLFFEGGAYTGCTSTFRTDRLGEVLWKNGRISLDQLLIAVEMMKEGGKMLGRVLIELGFLEPTALRVALVEQAAAVFDAACLEEKGTCVFHGDIFHKNPMRFGAATKKVISDAVDHAREYRELSRKLGSLERRYEVREPATSTQLSEQEQALLQLAASSREAHTGRELIKGASLGKLAGARALKGLIDKSFLAAQASPDDVAVRLKRLCAAINLSMAALDEAGFGVGDQVRELADNPPAEFEDAFSGLSLDAPLDDAAVTEQASFLTGGMPSMVAALQAILDEALRQMHDTLSAELTKRVLDRVRALGLAT